MERGSKSGSGLQQEITGTRQERDETQDLGPFPQLELMGKADGDRSIRGTTVLLLDRTTSVGRE